MYRHKISTFSILDDKVPVPCVVVSCRKVLCTGSFSAEVNRPGREADRPLPCNAEVTNVWSYTSTMLACTETALRLIKGRRGSVRKEVLSGAHRSVCTRVFQYSEVGQFREVSWLSWK